MQEEEVGRVAGVVTVLVELGLPLEIAWKVVYKWGGLGQHPLAVAYWTSPERHQYLQRFALTGRYMLRQCLMCSCGRRELLQQVAEAHCKQWNAEYPPGWPDVDPGTATPRPSRVLKRHVGHMWRKPSADRRGVHPIHDARGCGLNPEWSVRKSGTYGCGTASLWRRHFDLEEPVHTPGMYFQHYFDPVNVVTEEYPHMCASALWLTICNTGDDATREDAKSKMDEYIGRGRNELLKLSLRF